MQKPLISVLVPVYNVEKYLKECVKSIIAQTYKNLEIILVNDGSTDKSGTICDDFAKQDKRIKVIHQQNAGLVCARKTALAHATGDYVGMVDSDDWIEPCMYEALLNKALQTDADFVDSGFSLEYQTNGRVKKQEFAEKYYDLSNENAKKHILAYLLNTNECCFNSVIWSKLYKKHVIIDAYNGVPNKNTLGEDDINFLNLLLCAKSAYYLNNFYYHYRCFDVSMSKSYGVTGFKKYIDAANVQDAFVRKNFNIDEKTLGIWYMRRVLGLFARIDCTQNIRINTYRFANVAQFFGKKLCIYGAGAVGEDFYSQLAKYQQITITAWVDKNANTCKYDFCTVQSASTIQNVDCDYILVAVLKQSVAEQITQELVLHGIDRTKIIWQKPLSLVDALCSPHTSCTPE